MKRKLPKKIGFSKRDREISIKNGKIVYTKNQQAVLDAALQGLMPTTTKEFKLLKDILTGDFKLKYPAKSAGKGLTFADTEETIKLVDNPLLRLMEAFYSLFGKDFGTIYHMVLLARPKERKKALKIAEGMMIRMIENERKQKRCKHQWQSFKENPERFVECIKCALVHERKS